MTASKTNPPIILRDTVKLNLLDSQASFFIKIDNPFLIPEKGETKHEKSKLPGVFAADIGDD